jgi:hypothetical protein
LKQTTLELILLSFLAGWMLKWCNGAGHQNGWDVIVIVLAAGGAFLVRLLCIIGRDS